MTIYNNTGTPAISYNRYKDSSPLSFTTNLALITDGSGNTDKRANIKLNITPNGSYCYPPDNLLASNITTSSADITWTTNTSGNSWIVQYKQALETTWSDNIPDFDTI